MADEIRGVPIGDLSNLGSVPDDSLFVTEFLGKAYSLPGGVLRQLMEDIVAELGGSIDSVTEERLKAAIETVLATGKYSGVSPMVEVVGTEGNRAVLRVTDAKGVKEYPFEVNGATQAVQYVVQALNDTQKRQARENIGAEAAGTAAALKAVKYNEAQTLTDGQKIQARENIGAVSASDVTSAIQKAKDSGEFNGRDGYTPIKGVDYRDGVDGKTPVKGIDYKDGKDGKSAYAYAVSAGYTGTEEDFAKDLIDPGSVIVKISGSVTAGFTVLLNGESVTNEILDELAGEGHRVIGIAQSEVKVLNYKVPAGTLFEYTNVFEFEDNGVVGSTGARRFVFRVQVDDCNFTLRCTDGVWGGILQPIQATFFLKRNNGVPFIQYNGKTILPEDANWLSVQLILCEVQHRPVFCFQGDMQFFTDNNTAIQPPWGTAFSLRINDDNDYYFATEYDGYELQLLISPDGFVNSARKTSVYKAVESKADDLKAEDGTLFLLSAGEPIGAGVSIPTGNNNVFIGNYDTVTFSAIKIAHRTGKVCFLNNDGLMLPLLSLSDTEAIFVREINENTDYRVTITVDGGKSFTMQDKNISDVYVSGLFSAKYAEAKAAYEAGKACFVTYGALLCPLTVLDAEKAEFVGMLTPNMGIKGTVPAEGTIDWTYVRSNAVQTVEQSLTDAQKAQARTNIGALSTDDIDTVLQQAKDSGQFDGKDGEDGYTPVKGVDYFDGKDGYTPVKGKDYFDGYTPVKGKDYFDGANGKTAYAYAQDGGYTGTETEFAAKLASGSEPLKVTLSGNDTDGYTADKTVAEIYAARNAGRDVYMVGGVVTYQLSYLSSSFAAFSYTMASRNAIEIISVIMMSGVAPTRIHQTIDDSYVKYTAQSLDEEYKLQARSNIGALGTGGGTLSGGLDFSDNTSWVTPYLLAFKNDDPNANPTYPYTGFYQWGDEWQVNARDAANNWVKNLLSINNITGIANFAAVPTVNGAQLALSSDISSGNANTSTMPLGFASRVAGATWGNTIGTSFTSWNDPTGGSIDFRQDNPSSGKMSIKVDGRVYVNEGLNPVMAMEHANDYWGMTSPDGENNAWIRTTTSGIIPFQSGGAGSGHCYLGTSSWYFGESYIDRMYGTNLSLAGRAYMNEWIQCNSEGGLFFPNHNGLHIMANTVSTYTPLRIVGERTTYNGVLFGNDSTGLNVMSNAEHQGLYNESLSRWITYYHRPTDKIGIGTADLSSEFLTIGGSASVSGRIIASGGAYISGRCQGGGDDEGIVIGRASNDYAGLTLGGATGVHATLYLLPDNSTVWRYHNGSAAYDIKHPGKAGTIALTSDVAEAVAPLRVNYNTTSQTVDKTLSEIKAAWDAGRSVVLTDGTSVYPLNYVDTSEAVFSSFAINANSKFFFDSVHINSSGKVRYYSYSN